jgi:plasmid stability protein
LIVRNIDEDVALALKQRAAANGRSAEAEHCEILKAALKRPRRRSVSDVRPTYFLADLVAQCSSSAPEPVDMAAWSDAKPLGRETW